MSSLTTDFKNAAEKLKQLKADPGNEIKLKLYAMFKQVKILIKTSIKYARNTVIFITNAHRFTY